MRTQVILENQNDYAKQENKEFDKLMMKSILLTLLEQKKITQPQYDECKKRLNIF